MIDDVCHIIDESRQYAYQTVNASLVLRNWLIGKRIDDAVLERKERAKYGAEVIANLAEALSDRYGKGFSKRILYQCLRVYRMFPGIVNEVRSQFKDSGKVNEAGSQFGLLSWTHIGF